MTIPDPQTVILRDHIEEPLAEVHLTLEEAGTLYHLLMGSLMASGINPAGHVGQQIMAKAKRQSIMFPVEVEVAIANRQIALLRRLGRASDLLLRSAT